MQKRKDKLPKSIREYQELAEAFDAGIKAGIGSDETTETILTGDQGKKKTEARRKMPRGFLSCRFW